MSTNAKSRIHHNNVRPGSGHDLFYQLDSKTYRLYEAGKDPSPIYKDGYVEKSTEFEHDDSIIQKRFQIAKKNLPNYITFMNPVLQALKSLGGSGAIEEINNKTSEIARLSNEQLEVLHNPEKGGQTEVEYRFAWARTYLKKYGVLENSARGIWALTAEGRKLDSVDPKKVRLFVLELLKKAKAGSVKDKPAETDLNTTLTTIKDEEPDEIEPDTAWREELSDTLLKMEPSAFERLAQRLLRESGFTQVEVTGQSGDGGIDGKGIMRLGGLLSFPVIFQCKRYQGSVTASQVRDFRGATVGRADKALLITTGNYTKAAMKEATRDGAPVIDLIDRNQLVDKLKELGLGVKTEKVEVEKVTIKTDWFMNI
ncbi:restriction endonuclease [Desulfococcaceae bacterium HSG9]|nr:restriction endonuclease [Desulfococcaceae bacterium HSG9]